MPPSKLSPDSGVVPLAKGWGDYNEGTAAAPAWSQCAAGRGWCVDLCKELGYIPPAWAFHFYGPQTADGPEGGGAPAGWDSLKTMLEYLKGNAYAIPGLPAYEGLPARGTNLSAPIYITETGVTIPGEGSEDEQALNLNVRILEAAALGVKAFYIFSAVGGEYGIYTPGLTPQPSRRRGRSSCKDLVS